MNFVCHPSGVCCKEIRFTLDGNVVSNISFQGGCDGNLKTISKLLNGKTVEEIEKGVGGIKCGGKNTSCSDQLAKFVRQAYEKTMKAVIK